LIGSGCRCGRALSLALMAAALFEISALRAKVTVSIAVTAVTASAISLFVVVAIAGRRSAAAGDEGGQTASACVLLAAATLLRIALEIRLRLRLRRLRSMLLLRLRHRRAADVRLRIRIARGHFVPFAIPIVEFVAAFHIGALIGRLLRLVRILLRELSLRGRDQTEVMLGVLQIAFGRYRIARGLGIARELYVFFGNVMRGAAHLHVRPVRLVNAGKWIVSAVAIAAPHALLLLSVSHFGKSLCSAAGRRLLRARHQRMNDRHANPVLPDRIP
jgi:hypothetical protein